MLHVGPAPPLPGSDETGWRVTAHGVLVASMARDAAGHWWAHLNLHHATVPGRRVQHVRLTASDPDRLGQWARANEARLLRECEPIPPPPPPDLSPEAFGLMPPQPRKVRRRPAFP